MQVSMVPMAAWILPVWAYQVRYLEVPADAGCFFLLSGQHISTSTGHKHAGRSAWPVMRAG